MRNVSKRGRKPCPLIDCPLRIQFGGHIGPADHVACAACRLQRICKAALTELARTQNHPVPR